jgi:PBP1b-binding outer membrane lipoprotein LpoB
MKRIITAILVLSLVLLTGCSDEEASSDSTEGDKTTETSPTSE